MPWLLTSPGHQQPWYWLYVICRSFSYLRKDFKYMRMNDIKCKYMLMFPLKNLACKGLKILCNSLAHWAYPRRYPNNGRHAIYIYIYIRKWSCGCIVSGWKVLFQTLVLIIFVLTLKCTILSGQSRSKCSIETPRAAQDEMLVLKWRHINVTSLTKYSIICLATCLGWQQRHH